MKKHSSAAIVEKLAQADQLAARGVSQSVICKQLGISVMTLHRWRTRASTSAGNQLEQKLMVENNRLRNVAASLLLEIRALEEERDEPTASGELAGGHPDQAKQREPA